MFHPNDLPAVREAIRTCTARDQRLLDDLRQDVRLVQGNVHAIKPRTTTAVSLVASDGGNNKLVFDPFYIQLVRVVDSYGQQLFLDAVSPSSDPDALSTAQFNSDGMPRTPLGTLMADLGVQTLHELSYMIPDGRTVRENPEKVSPLWVQAYRDLCEWAVLYDLICHRPFATDTLLVRDGLLRSVVFRGKQFNQMWRLIESAIDRVYRETRRRLFLVGIAKHSKVLTRYQLAMIVEQLFPPNSAYYVRIPRELEMKAVVWPEWVRGFDSENAGAEVPKFVAGEMYFVRFGVRSGDPVWTVDLFGAQAHQAPEIFGHLLSDAVNGFPVPFYPLCLQRAHEHAQIVDLDLHILQQEVFRSVLELLPVDKHDDVEAFRLADDPADRRYT